jgi:membrane protein implicated in regulation of membrane protease activity
MWGETHFKGLEIVTTLLDWPPNHWHWLILGIFLIISEFMVSGIFLLWIGFGALITGFFMALFGFDLTVQLLVFAACSGVAVAIGLKVYPSRHQVMHGHSPNTRRQAMIGQRYTVLKTFENGIGSVKVADGQWRAQLDQSAQTTQITEGDHVQVVRIEGTTLFVVPVVS